MDEKRNTSKYLPQAFYMIGTDLVAIMLITLVLAKIRIQVSQ